MTELIEDCANTSSEPETIRKMPVMVRIVSTQRATLLLLRDAKRIKARKMDTIMTNTARNIGTENPGPTNSLRFDKLDTEETTPRPMDHRNSASNRFIETGRKILPSA
jgi:hypothetical protein